MMAVTVERALAFPLRDSWVPCRDGGVKRKEEKRLRGPQMASPSVRPLAPQAPWTKLGRCLQPSHSKTGIANSRQPSQVISQQIFPPGLRLEGDTVGLKQSCAAKVKKQQGKKKAVFKGRD